MSYRRMLAVAAQTMLVGIVGPTYAAGPIGPDSDILGIKLTMSREQAKKTITNGFPGSQAIELPAQMGTAEYKKSTVGGFFADVTTAADQANNQRTIEQANKEFEAKKAAGFGDSPLNRTIGAPGDVGHDRVVVLYDPNDGATGIFAVSRRKEFTKANFVPAKVLLDSFIEKYGPPSRTNGGSFTWTAPGVLQRTQKSPAKCYNEFGDYFYESGNDRFFSEQFVNFLNLIASKNPNVDFSQCGTVLQVNFTLSNDKLSALGMTETLIDLTRGYAEVKAFSDDFWLHANAAKQEKLMKDSQNKPKL